MLLCTLNGIAQEYRELPRARKRAISAGSFYVSRSDYDYSAIAKEITASASTQYDKARELYTWICRNISYDTDNSIRTADECWDKRKAVCQGVCELFYRMAETLGIKTKLVYGKCKHYDATLENHVWLCVTTEKGDILLDPTWGAGSYINGRYVRLHDPQIWFDTDPHWFVFTHLPNKNKEQHLDRTVSETEFSTLPYLTSRTAILGITPGHALAHALGGGDAFPVIHARNTALLQHVSMISIPHVLHLKVGIPYTFTIEKLKDCKLSIENNSTLYAEEQWTCNDNIYTITILPLNRGELKLKVSVTNEFFDINQPILEYVVE